MSHTLFVSDVHLQPSRPDIGDAFLRLLRAGAQKRDALYLLGDLFEAWIGDDDNHPFYTHIKAALRGLTDLGIPVYLMRGNRDFLIGARFAAETGCRLLADPATVTLYGTRAVLTHGDRLCTQDKGHLLFRAVVQSRWNRCFLALPLAWRRRIARTLRQQSAKHTYGKPAAALDVCPETVARILREAGASLLIHGHTHRPAIHVLNVAGKAARRITLGAWENGAETLAYYPDGTCHLKMTNDE